MPIQTAIDSISQNQGSPFGFKNRIINGGMVIDQRNAGASVTPTTNATYVVDRWMCGLNQSSKFSVQRSTTSPVGFTNSTLITSLSSYTAGSSDFLYYAHKIEGLNCGDLGWGTTDAKAVTISFWIRSSLTGNFSLRLVNSNFNRSYVTTYTINSANTWEYKTITVAGDTTGTWETNTNSGIELAFDLGSGSTYTTSSTNSWQASAALKSSGSVSLLATNAATLYLTGVQFGVGRQASSFDWRPYGTELQLCQRYYQRFENVSDPNGVIGTGSVWISTIFFMVLPYTVPMRALPTGSSSGSTSITLLVNSAAKQASAVSFQNYSKVAVEVLGTSSSMTAGQAGFVRFTAAADFLALSAEL